MNFPPAFASVDLHSHFLEESFKKIFHNVFRNPQRGIATDSPQHCEERISKLADCFLTHLQDNLERFNGADPELNTLIERLKPFKSPHLQIEPLLGKIIQDLLVQNRKLMEFSAGKVVPFSSSDLIPEK